MDKNIRINGINYKGIDTIKVKDAVSEELHAFRNIDDADIKSSDVMLGKVGYGKDGKVIGTYIPPTGEIDGGINFYDQYGAWLTSYRLEDLPLSALPEIPALEGAGADQYEFAWTMTLEEVNALTEEADIGVDVTAKEGSKTYLIPDKKGFSGGTSDVYFYGGDETSTILIDWGDGKETTLTIQANRDSSRTEHTFSNASHNPITIEKISGGDFYLGAGGSSRFIYSILKAKEIRVGYGVKGITQEFLTDNYSVENVILHNTMVVKNVGNPNIFEKCHRLKSLNIPKSFKQLGTTIVHTCPRIETIFIHEGVESINMIANNGYSLKKIVFPESIKDIKLTQSSYGYLVYGTYALTKLKLPKSVEPTNIAGSFVDYCYAIKEISVPEGVTSIGQYFARNCYSLDSITLPSTLTSIGSNFLYYVSGLKQIIMKSTEPPTLSSSVSAFTNTTYKPTLYVPKGSLEAYATATNWSALAGNIVEY